MTTAAVLLYAAWLVLLFGLLIGMVFNVVEWRSRARPSRRDRFGSRLDD